MATEPPSTDLLEHCAWECAHTPPGAVSSPDALNAAHLDWLPAAVPGTAAGARAAAGYNDADSHPYDDSDWWFRCRFPAGAGRALLRCEGLATVADAWLDGRHLLHSENMFLPAGAETDTSTGDNELVLRFAALGPLLAERK